MWLLVKWFVALSLLVALAGGGLTIGPAASAQVPDSEMTVATGTVTTASGAAMSDETVGLYAWPQDSKLEALKSGQPVPTTLLVTATTNDAGKYILRVPATALRAAAVSSGYANLEIASAGGGFWFFPYQTGSLPTQPVAPVTVNLSADKGPVCGSKGPKGQQLFFTGFFKERQRRPAPATVGQGYIGAVKTRGDSVQFNYNQTSTHTQASTLGVGISGYGFDAGYSTTGTTVSTADQSQDFAAQSRNTWFQTYFSVAQYRGICFVSPDETIKHKKQHGQCPAKTKDATGDTVDVYKCIWLVGSTGWDGGGNIVHPKNPPSTPAKYCGPETKGITVMTSNEKAIDWSTGWDLGGSLGIKGVNLKASYSASSQTGYDSNDQMTFTFRHTGFICGTNHKPNKAAQLVMRGTKS